MKKPLLISFLLAGIMLFLNSNTSAQVKGLLIGRNDTLVFQASNYVIQPNDKLNDLLKRIPAITVDNKGKIYAQGDAIERILVDEGEFFTEDPSVATQILRADKVDKIKFTIDGATNQVLQGLMIM